MSATSADNNPGRITASLAAIRRNFAFIWFLAGFGFLCFGYGVACMLFELPPRGLVMRSMVALHQMEEVRDERVYEINRIGVAAPGAGVTTCDSNRAYAGLTLMTLHDGSHNVARLIDMKGETLHEWNVVYSELWPDPSHLEYHKRDPNYVIQSAHLFGATGDILLNFNWGGLVKLDRNGEVLWRLSENTHHDFAVRSDGSILVCGRQTVTVPSDEPTFLPRIFYDDQILTVSPDGELLSRMSVMDCIRRSRYEGILLANAARHQRLLDVDPVHLNNIEVIPESLAGHPVFQPGALLLSLRNLNALLLLDPESGEVLWSMTGPFLRQHDPDVLPNGDLLLFDNRADLFLIPNRHMPELHYRRTPQVFGYSRVLQIDPVSGRIRAEYSGTRERPFYSSIQGAVQHLPNGNWLVVEPERGRVLELAGPNHDEVVWEFVNRLEDAPGVVGRVLVADRFAAEQITFLR